MASTRRGGAMRHCARLARRSAPQARCHGANERRKFGCTQSDAPNGVLALRLVDHQGVQRDVLSLSSRLRFGAVGRIGREPLAGSAIEGASFASQYRAPTGHKGAVNAVSPDGRIALSGGGDGACKVWDLTAPSPANLLRREARVYLMPRLPTWLLALVMRSVPCCPLRPGASAATHVSHV
jgi:WD domain, G-beta repeat